MNPLVSEMLGVSARNDLEIQSLEELLNDDCNCESPHTASECSLEVTHISDACKGGEWKICLSAATMNQHWMNSGLRCKSCNRELKDCWTIRPI